MVAPGQPTAASPREQPAVSLAPEQPTTPDVTMLPVSVEEEEDSPNEDSSSGNGDSSFGDDELTQSGVNTLVNNYTKILLGENIYKYIRK